MFFVFPCFPVKLAHFSPTVQFFTPWKIHKSFGFLAFSENMEVDNWEKIVSATEMTDRKKKTDLFS